MLSFQEMFDDLFQLENVEDKYEWIIDYGGGGIGLPASAKTDENLIKGCTSSLWVVKKNNKLICDAESFIVKGFSGIICDWYNQASKDDQDNFSINTLTGIGLAPLLSMGRQNGIANLIAKIKTL